MAVISTQTQRLTRLTGTRTAAFSPLTLTAATLTLTGLLIATLEIRWSLQLISLTCVYSGALLATMGLLIHLLRRNLAWAADGSLLLGLGALLFSSPLLPAAAQDYLEYLMP